MTEIIDEFIGRYYVQLVWQHLPQIIILFIIVPVYLWKWKKKTLKMTPKKWGAAALMLIILLFGIKSTGQYARLIYRLYEDRKAQTVCVCEGTVSYEKQKAFDFKDMFSTDSLFKVSPVLIDGQEYYLSDRIVFNGRRISEDRYDDMKEGLEVSGTYLTHSRFLAEVVAKGE